MDDIAKATVIDSLALPSSQIGSFIRATSRAQSTHFTLVVAGAFVLYWASSFILAASTGGTTYFGADGNVFAELADGEVNARLARFHPVTVAMAVAWMKMLSHLTPLIAPQHLLGAMFAAVGAAGVASALWAFSAVLPRRYVALFGIIYALSFGVWYAASIDESKIITASLSALYIAIYLHLRDRWSKGGAVLLTAVLLLDCLNEVVAGFLLAIPIVDTLIRRGVDWRQDWWIALHALSAPLALVFLETVVNGHLVASTTDPEGASHLSMLFYYLSKNEYNADNLYGFVEEWFLFNIAAPSTDATYGAAPQFFYSGDFEPALRHYFLSPASACLAVLTVAITAASFLPRYRPDGSDRPAGLTALLWGLVAYALVRAVFFVIYLPSEPLLNSPAVTLAHLLIVSVLFAETKLPAKRTLLGLFAVLLLMTNAAFILNH